VGKLEFSPVWFTRENGKENWEGGGEGGFHPGSLFFYIFFFPNWKENEGGKWVL
jgi:hypothetical protein